MEVKTNFSDVNNTNERNGPAKKNAVSDNTRDTNAKNEIFKNDSILHECSHSNELVTNNSQNQATNDCYLPEDNVEAIGKPIPEVSKAKSEVLEKSESCQLIVSAGKRKREPANDKDSVKDLEPVRTLERLLDGEYSEGYDTTSMSNKSVENVLCNPTETNKPHYSQKPVFSVGTTREIGCQESERTNEENAESENCKKRRVGIVEDTKSNSDEGKLKGTVELEEVDGMVVDDSEPNETLDSIATKIFSLSDTDSYEPNKIPAIKCEEIDYWIPEEVATLDASRISEVVDTAGTIKQKIVKKADERILETAIALEEAEENAINVCISDDFSESKRCEKIYSTCFESRYNAANTKQNSGNHLMVKENDVDAEKNAAEVSDDLKPFPNNNAGVAEASVAEQISEEFKPFSDVYDDTAEVNIAETRSDDKSLTVHTEIEQKPDPLVFETDTVIIEADIVKSEPSGSPERACADLKDPLDITLEDYVVFIEARNPEGHETLVVEHRLNKGNHANVISVCHDDNVTYACEDCKFETHSVTDIFRHYNNNTEGVHGNANYKRPAAVKPYKCTKCVFRTKFRKTLKLHYKFRHNCTVKLYECSHRHCVYMTEMKEQLLRHLKRCHVKKTTAVRAENSQ